MSLDASKWYDCARCDAGYDSGPLEQECTCNLCGHGANIKECYLCAMLAMHPNSRLIKKEKEAIIYLQELEEVRENEK